MVLVFQIGRVKKFALLNTISKKTKLQRVCLAYEAEILAEQMCEVSALFLIFAYVYIH